MTKAKEEYSTTDLTTICELASSWFIRQDNKFYSVEQPTVKLSKNDVEMIILHRLREECPDIELSNGLLRAMFRRIIVERHTDRQQTIPVWSGVSVCDAGTDDRFIWKHGAVSLNTWRRPDYRSLRINSEDLGPLPELLTAMFATQAEADQFLDWLSWCLQNEADKPFWAPFLYSRSKGTGKSTLCNLAAQLFGLENTATQNNVDQLTGRFNSTILLSKLVVCEETHLRPGSSQGNTLKVNITEEQMLIERKGRESERIQQRCCFLFTSNHFPSWMEPGERRYQVFEVDHSGCAGGPKAEEFGKLVATVRDYFSKAENLGSLYNALMKREQVPEFNAKSLNMVHYSTDIMRRISDTSEHTIVDQLRETLDARGLVVVPQSMVAEIIRKDLGGTTNQTKHLMDDLGWRKCNLKWGGVDYARAIWHRAEVNLDAGRIYGADHDGRSIADYLADVAGFEAMEIIQ